MVPRIDVRLILVRHGHCEGSGTYCGRTDSPLTDKGRAQAAAAAAELAGTPISVCFSSPLSRAMETARILCSQRAIGILPSPLIRELDFGQWEGLTYPQIAARWPDLAERWTADPMQVAIPGGETFLSLRRRVRSFLQGLPPMPLEGEILIVAHGGSLAALMMEAQSAPASEFFNLVPPLGSIQAVQWLPRVASGIRP